MSTAATRPRIAPHPRIAVHPESAVRPKLPARPKFFVMPVNAGIHTLAVNALTAHAEAVNSTVHWDDRPHLSTLGDDCPRGEA